MSDLQRLIAKGAGQYLDFQKEITNSQKIASTIVAFANSEGGSILIGVKGNGKIKGIDPSEENYLIDQAIQKYVKPIMNITSSVWQEKHHLVLEVIVPKSSVLHTAKDVDGEWKSFVRLGNHTCHSNKIIDLSWRLRDDAMSNSKYSKQCQYELLLLLEDSSRTLSNLYKDSKYALKEVDYNLSCLIYKKEVQVEYRNEHFQYKLNR